MKTIELIASRTGQTTVQTKGLQGTACQEASRFLEQALGARISEERTAEFYQTQTDSVRQSSPEGA